MSLDALLCGHDLVREQESGDIVAGLAPIAYLLAPKLSSELSSSASPAGGGMTGGTGP